jgi:hypothetical protein
MSGFCANGGEGEWSDGAMEWWNGVIGGSEMPIAKDGACADIRRKLQGQDGSAA